MRAAIRYALRVQAPERDPRAQGQHHEVHRGRLPRLGLRPGHARVPRPTSSPSARAGSSATRRRTPAISVEDNARAIEPGYDLMTDDAAGARCAQEVEAALALWPTPRRRQVEDEDPGARLDRRHHAAAGADPARRTSTSSRRPTSTATTSPTRWPRRSAASASPPAATSTTRPATPSSRRPTAPRRSTPTSTR